MGQSVAVLDKSPHCLVSWDSKAANYRSQVTCNGQFESIYILFCFQFTLKVRFEIWNRIQLKGYFTDLHYALYK